MINQLGFKDVLHRELGFDGVVISDSLTMKAVATGSYSDRAQKALSASCDLLTLMV